MALPKLDSCAVYCAFVVVVVVFLLKSGKTDRLRTALSIESPRRHTQRIERWCLAKATVNSGSLLVLCQDFSHL